MHASQVKLRSRQAKLEQGLAEQAEVSTHKAEASVEVHKARYWCPECLGDLQVGAFAPKDHHPDTCHHCKVQWSLADIVITEQGRHAQRQAHHFGGAEGYEAIVKDFVALCYNG